MKKDRIRTQRRAMHIALIAGAASLCFATAASADSQAAKKLGQMSVINQTLQPKPLPSPSAPANNYSNTPNVTAPNPNPSVSPNYNAAPTYNRNAINAANAANATNAARVNAIPGAPPPAASKR